MKLNETEQIARFALPIFAAASSLALSTPIRAEESTRPATPTPSAASSTQTTTKNSSQRKDEAAQSRDLAEREAKATLDRDAVAAIEQTQKAVKAIEAGKTAEALASIEQASGKIAILVARKPTVAMIPVEVEVQLVDTAPTAKSEIAERARDADEALDRKDYSTARVTLEGLSSELRHRTYHLPLASYPHAMQRAARLLDEKKTDEARTVLQTALNTLIVTETRTPLPILVAEAAIKDAQGKRESDKAAARKLLASAREELDRAELLGYAKAAPEYGSLNQSIEELEKQLQGTDNTTSAFTALRSKVTEFVDRFSKSAESETVPKNTSARN
ncbi:MAG TPA: YfdX family protein [Steroidobacteraceae bacterium]|nr:YfdX family protein [Steroidobacteraceae bacterium]